MKKLFLILSVSGLVGILCAQSVVECRVNKVSEWKSYRAERFAETTAFTPRTIPTNAYGSNINIRSTATGFFRTEKLQGRWYIIDPEGYAFIHKAVACVSAGTSVNNRAAVTARWATNEAWCAYTNNWLKAEGFNGAGAWSDVDRLRQQAEPVVYTVIVSPMSNYRNYHKKLVGGYSNAGWQGYEHNIVRVFDPLFETYMHNACKSFVKYRDDKFLLGYFIDNELPWANDALDRHLKYLLPGDACYTAAKEWLDARKGKNALLADITEDDRTAFWDYYAGRYFSLAKKYLTLYDPNHLFLGSRFNQRKEELANPHIFATAGKYCDIISINHYQEWEPIASRMSSWEEWSGVPFLITEFYTKGEDAPGLLNATGAGWNVRTQRDRALFYENFIIKLLRSSGCVGWNWFRYQDNDPDDLTTDPSNRDSNKGLVNVTYEPYAELMPLIRAVNANVYPYLEFLCDVKTKEISASKTRK